MFSKPLILTLLVSISLNGLFGYLSYHFYGERASSLILLDESVAANKSLESSLEKKEAACLVTDTIVTEYQKEKQEIVGKKDSDLSVIDKMVTKSTLEPKAEIVARGATQDEETNVVDIDGRLPDALQRVLSESCHNSKGSICSSP